MNVQRWKAVKPAKNCPDCGVEPGSCHVPGCDVECCSACGDQRIGCNCREAGLQRLYGRLGALVDHALNASGALLVPVSQLEELYNQADPHEPEKARWTGWLPGELECVQRDWFAWFDGRRWHRCGFDHSEAHPDLNRWAQEGFPKQKGDP